MHDGVAFVGRRDELAMIRRAFTEVPPSAIVLYGVGGTGKTTLLRQVGDDCDSRRLAHAFLGLAGGQLSTGTMIGRELRDQLHAQRDDLYFPRFDLAAGIEAAGSKGPVSAEVKDLVDILGLMQAFPVIGDAITLAERTYRYAGKAQRRLVEQRVAPWLEANLPGVGGWKERLAGASPEDLARLIPSAFIADIKVWASETTGVPLPVVLLIDDVHLLFGPADRSPSDEASPVRHLAEAIMQTAAPVALILGSRELPHWGQLRTAKGSWVQSRSSPWAGKPLIASRIGDLTIAEASAYLLKRGVPVDTADRIVDVVGGYPLGLAIAAEVWSGSLTGPALDDLSVLLDEHEPYSADWHEELAGWLLKRLLDHLRERGDEQLIRLLELAAVARWFDEALLIGVTEFGAGEFDRLVSYSFVEKFEAPFGDAYRLHAHVRQFLNQDRSANRLRRRRMDIRAAIRERATSAIGALKISLEIEDLALGWKLEPAEAAQQLDTLWDDPEFRSVRADLIASARDGMTAPIEAPLEIDLLLRESMLWEHRFNETDPHIRHDQAMALLDRALKIAGNDPLLIARVRLRRSEVLSVGQRPEAAPEAAAAAASARAAGDPVLLARALMLQATITFANPDHGRAELIDEAVRLHPGLDRIGPLRERLIMAMRAGQTDTLEALLPELQASDASVRDPHARASNLHLSGEGLATLGRWREAGDAFEEAARRFEALSEQRGLCAATGWRGLALCRLGDDTAGMKLVNDALRIERDVLGSREGVAKWLGHLGHLHLDRAEPSKAFGPLWMARDLHAELEHPGRSRIDALLVRCAELLGAGAYGELEEGFDPRRSEYSAFAFLWGLRGLRKATAPVLVPSERLWESFATFNAAAVSRGEDGVTLAYRAQGSAEVAPSIRRSVLGRADSSDGRIFVRESQPMFGPEAPYELPGGCEDPRIIQATDGGYFMTYTAFDGTTARLAGAQSKDLRTWERLGPLLPDLGWSKSGAILDRQINGLYWMYFGDTTIRCATSPDLLHWTIIEGPVLSPREGYFDDRLVEPGPPPVMTDDGILLVYNGADQGLHYAVGQALFDRRDPRRLLRRSGRPILSCTTETEQVGNVPNVVFAEGLVQHRGFWHLYYGMADTRLGVATSALDPSAEAASL